MPQDHRLPQQRFELKYLVEERITGRLRDFARSYLEVDEYGAGRQDFAYPVHSLYLDSEDLSIHHAGVNGTRNRFKLRLRYYDDRPESPVFFEIKRRADNCILKQRCGVRRAAMPLVLAGQLPGPDDLVSPEPRHLATMQRFNLLMTGMGARPTLHNSYLREAWVSPHNNSVRLTFDRQVRAEPCFYPQTALAMERPARVFPELVILELKFTDRYPDWFKELTRRFNLMQSSSAKYCEGVEVIGPHRLRQRDPIGPWEHTAQARPAPVEMPLPLMQTLESPAL